MTGDKVVCLMTGDKSKIVQRSFKLKLFDKIGSRNDRGFFCSFFNDQKCIFFSNNNNNLFINHCKNNVKNN
jgi:hypothetical protein